MKITSTQAVLDFFGDEQVIQDLLQNFNQVADDDSEDDSDYEESETEEDSDDEHEEDSEDEEEEKHQFYRQQAQEWQEHQELEEAKANELFEDEWRYREMFENEIRSAQLTQQQANNVGEEIPPLVTDDSESDTEELVEEQQPIHLGPPPVLRRERASDYLTPVRNIEVRTPEAPERRRVLGDITNITIRPRRLRFNN